MNASNFATKVRISEEKTKKNSFFISKTTQINYFGGTHWEGDHGVALLCGISSRSSG